MKLLAPAAVLLLCACNPVPPLGNADKAKFVFELIEPTHNCDVYRKRLEVPSIDGPAIDAIYREVIAGGCIKRDV